MQLGRGAPGRGGRKLRELWDSKPFSELSSAQEREEAEIEAWLAGQPQVEATRTTWMAPKQWEGTVDGHSFYFRERHDFWRIELDLAESGRFARRLLRLDDEGSMVTEPVPIMEGEVIAEGTGLQLGGTPVDHIASIVRTIRDHLWSAQCALLLAEMRAADKRGDVTHPGQAPYPPTRLKDLARSAAFQATPGGSAAPGAGHQRSRAKVNGYQRSSGPSRIRTPAPGSAIVPGLSTSSPTASARCLPTSRTESAICSAGHSDAPTAAATPLVPPCR
ncbi:MAG: hypothetical protein ACREOE_15230 [Gemmatimonadales bacterium]